MLAAHPQIAWVQLPLAGVEALAEGGVIDRQRQWTSAKGAYAEPVAEHALALLLAGLRQLPMRARARSWGEPGAATLFDQPVTVVGGGGLATELLRLLEPFRSPVTVVRQRPEPLAGAARTVGTDRLAEALAGARAVVLMLALTPLTRKLIGRAELAAMERDAWLVNVARGGVVDTGALVDALRSGQIGGAALDVTDPEPLPDGHPLWDLPNCLITPHTADTEEMRRALLAPPDRRERPAAGRRAGAGRPGGSRPRLLTCGPPGWIRAADYLPMSMVRWSCSLPQTLELGVQAEMKPSAIPVPFLKTLPDCAVTCTRTVWFWLVHPTCVDPKPLAIWLPERSVRLTSTKADRAPAHSIWTVRSAPAPLATSVAGEFTWISSRSGGEKNPAPGRPSPRQLWRLHPRSRARPGPSYRAGNVHLSSSFHWTGEGKGVRATHGWPMEYARPAIAPTVRGIAGTCQMKSKALCRRKAAAAAAAPAQAARRGGRGRARQSNWPTAARNAAASTAPMSRDR